MLKYLKYLKLLPIAYLTINGLNMGRLVLVLATFQTVLILFGLLIFMFAKTAKCTIFFVVCRNYVFIQLNPEHNQELILKMNALLNELIALEVGKNDGQFLPLTVRPKDSVFYDRVSIE